MASGAAFDYVAVGHVTMDVLCDEHGQRRQPGGGALYSGLQAARLGLRTLVITAGRAEELASLLGPLAGELELQVVDAPCITTFTTTGAGSARRQRVAAWAGLVPAAQIPPQAGILHLAPVARETPREWRCEAKLVGLTPQGLVRRWDRETGEIALAPIDPDALPQRCDAVVLSEAERECCEALLRQAPLAAVTAGEGPTELRLADGSCLHVVPTPAQGAHDDLGAGDVFAAAFFVALLEGRTPQQAAAFGNAAAQVRIERRGPDAIGDRSTIERRLP